MPSAIFEGVSGFITVTGPSQVFEESGTEFIGVSWVSVLRSCSDEHISLRLGEFKSGSLIKGEFLGVLLSTLVLALDTDAADEVDEGDFLATLVVM
jgi:hypothetical protein